MTKKQMFLFTFLLFWGTIVTANSPPPSAAENKKMTATEFEASLKYRQGDIVLPNGVATLKVSNDFRYLPPDDAERVLTQAWGNPPGHKTLGMLFSTNVSPVGQNSWGVVITYEKDGHVADQDADSINYDDLLKQMKEDVVISNQQRQKLGYPTVELIGWAAKPRYDKQSHKLYWAKELAFKGETAHTLNYNIRMLGREGVLILNAVGDNSQLANIEQDMHKVLAVTNFNPGHRYEEFNPQTDKVASYGIAALVAGGVAAAAKSGLLGKIVVFLLAAKKLVIIAVIGLFAWLVSLFRRKKSS